MRTGAYNINMDDNDILNSQCVFNDSECESDTCQIDLKYLNLIREFMNDNPFHTKTEVTSPGTCTPSPKDKRERRCEGTAPDVFPKRMSDLDQLLTRIDYVEDRIPGDFVVYNAGGRKLNDDRENIVINVKNQLITFVNFSFIFIVFLTSS